MTGSSQNALGVLNRALLHMGLAPVNFFDPDSHLLPENPQALAVARLYAPTVDEVQRSFDWQELTRATEMKAQEALETEEDEDVVTGKGDPIGVRVSTEKDYEGRWIFDLKGLDVLKPHGIRLPRNLAVGGAETVLTMSWRGSDLRLYNYEIVDNTLRAYLPHLYFLYSCRLSDVSSWSSELQDCVAEKLAANAAMASTGNAKLADYILKRYLQTTFPTAKRQQSRYKNGVQYMPWGGEYPLGGRAGGWFSG